LVTKIFFSPGWVRLGFNRVFRRSQLIHWKEHCVSTLKSISGLWMITGEVEGLEIKET
jgi:hypothetical protein